jgi:integrase
MTVHRRLRFAKSFFQAMKRRHLIEENPFADVKAPATTSPDRLRFVTMTDTMRVMEYCPDHHWRTIIALTRFGGLRCPSEVLSLQWQDIDWDASRITVRSPKTERLPGKATRTIPLFPELREPLATSFERASDGAVYVVDERFRKSANTAKGWANANLRTTLEKIIHRAGLTVWPRPFHNLRASRETELVERFPLHVVSQWLGNTPSIAMKHYLMVNGSDFTKAVEDGVEKAAKNPAQSVHAEARSEGNTKTEDSAKALEKRLTASLRKSLQDKGMDRKGFEPSTSALRTQRSPN